MLFTPRRFSLAALTLLLALATATSASAQDGEASWSVDDSRSSITFESDAPAERFTGTSESIEGSIDWNFDAPAESTGTISFPVATVRTGNSTRDRHLQNRDWLHADEYPTITFTLEGLSDLRTARTDSGQIHHRATADGSLEVRGVENSIEASVEIAIIPEQKTARVMPKLQFGLADHNIEGAGGDRAIGHGVGEVIDVRGTVYFNWE